MEYRHSQVAGLFLAVFAAAALVGTVGAFIGGDVVIGALALAFFVLIAAVLAGFSRLDVTVTTGQVKAAFGLGWPRRVIDLTTVRAVRTVRNKWWYGWGIRKIPRGWMYNVWGLDAVELELDGGKVFRIGTDEPDELLGALSLQVR